MLTCDSVVLNVFNLDLVVCNIFQLGLSDVIENLVPKQLLNIGSKEWVELQHLLKKGSIPSTRMSKGLLDCLLITNFIILFYFLLSNLLDGGQLLFIGEEGEII